MTQPIKRSSGFSIIELLIVLVLLAFIGTAGYFVFERTNNNRKLNVKTASNYQLSPPSTANTNETKPACVNQLCFQMPKIWTLSGGQIVGDTKIFNIESSNQTTGWVGNPCPSSADSCSAHKENEPDSTISISLSPNNGAGTLQQWWKKHNSYPSGLQAIRPLIRLLVPA